MKKLYTTIFLLFFLISNTAKAQEKLQLDASKFEQCLQEAYGKNTPMFYENPKRLEVMKKLYNERIFIVEQAPTTDDKYPKLSSVPLLSISGTNLQRDTTFNVATFNPFKYQMSFFAQASKAYRVDNTDYVIYITSQYK